MIAFVGSREGQEEQDRALFETMVKSKDDLFMVTYSRGLNQVAKSMVQDLCPVPSKYTTLSGLPVWLARCSYTLYPGNFQALWSATVL